VTSYFWHDAIDNDDESACRAAYLCGGASQRGDDKARDHRRVQSRLGVIPDEIANAIAAAMPPADGDTGRSGRAQLGGVVAAQGVE